jgi:hypothetical protein
MTSEKSLFDAGFHFQEAAGDHEDAPGGAVAENAADGALVGGGAGAELGAELGGKCSQAFIADFETDFGHGAVGGQHLTGAVHAQAGQEVVWSFSEGGAEEAVEMEFGETSLARSLLEQDAGLVFGGEQVASATEAAEGVVVEKRWHGEMILLCQHTEDLRG